MVVVLSCQLGGVENHQRDWSPERLNPLHMRMGILDYLIEEGHILLVVDTGI